MTAVVVMAACNGGMVYDRYTNTPRVRMGKERYALLQRSRGKVRWHIRCQSRAAHHRLLSLYVADAHCAEQRKVAADKAVTVVTDTVACQLTDRKGNAAGKGISYHQYQFPVTELMLQDGDSLFCQHST